MFKVVLAYNGLNMVTQIINNTFHACSIIDFSIFKILYLSNCKSKFKYVLMVGFVMTRSLKLDPILIYFDKKNIPVVRL
jgi:hypothetical protein